MEAIKYSIKVGRSNDKDIDKEWISELKKDLILKTVKIDREIDNTRDYVCKTKMKSILGDLFKATEEIIRLEKYLKEE